VCLWNIDHSLIYSHRHSRYVCDNTQYVCLWNIDHSLIYSHRHTQYVCDTHSMCVCGYKLLMRTHTTTRHLHGFYYCCVAVCCSVLQCVAGSMYDTNADYTDKDIDIDTDTDIVTDTHTKHRREVWALRWDLCVTQSQTQK